MLGTLAAKRERWVVKALLYFQKRNGFDYFHSYIPEFLSRGNSAYGYVPAEGISTRGMRIAFNDLKGYGIFDIEPEYAERGHTERHNFADIVDADIPYGSVSKNREFCVLAEINKYDWIRDYKLLRNKELLSNLKYVFYQEVEDLREYGFINFDDGSKGSRTYRITFKGREFMEYGILQ